MQAYNSRKDVKVLLINPPSHKGRIGRGRFFTPPMGLGYLAAYLQSKGITTDIIDCDPEKIFLDYFSPSQSQKHRLAQRIASYGRPLIVGIGPCTTPFLPNALAIAKFVKDYIKDSYVVIGGPHPSASPPNMAKKMLQRFEYIDAICINEGEKTLSELAIRLNNRDTNVAIEGLVFRSKKGYAYKERGLINSEGLNSLPFPSRDLLAKYSNNYRLAVRRSFLPILWDRERSKKYGQNPKFTVIFSSRGCPYQCTFCCSLSHRRIRSAENVVNEIELCVRNHDIHCFVFYDDLFTTSSPLEIERVESICNLLIKRGLEIFWEVELRADVVCSLGKETLHLMNKSGCCTVNIGIEKATDEALRWLQKGLNVDQIKRATQMLRESGNFIINGTFIFGAPFETQADILNIIVFSRELGIDYAAFYPLEIHPGTKVFELARKNGLVDDVLNPYITHGIDYPIFANKNLDVETLLELQCRAYREFYFNVDHIEFLIDKIHSVSKVYEQYEHFFEHAFIKRVR